MQFTSILRRLQFWNHYHRLGLPTPEEFITQYSAVPTCPHCHKSGWPNMLDYLDEHGDPVFRHGIKVWSGRLECPSCHATWNGVVGDPLDLKPASDPATLMPNA